MDKSIIILGGGPAGLAAARNLVKAGKKVTVLERSDAVGGLAGTFEWEGAKLDYGPHLFHAKKNQRVLSLFKELCLDSYKKVPSGGLARLFIRGRLLSYPLKLTEAAVKLNPVFVSGMLWDYFLANTKRIVFDVKEDSFEAWGVKRFGKRLYDVAFGFYSEKVWGMPASQLSHKLAQQKIPNVNLIDIFVEMLGAKGARQKEFYSECLYPTEGISCIFERISADIKATGSQLHTQASAEALIMDGRKISGVIIKDNRTGQTRREECEAVVSSIPIRDLIEAVSPLPETAIVNQARALKHRNIVLVYLMVDMPLITDKVMYYLLDKDFRFNRLSELKNLETGMIPPDKTVLCMEACASDKDGMWTAKDDELYGLAVTDLKRFGCKDTQKIRGYCVKKLKDAYPVFDIGYDERLKNVLSYLNKIDNLYYAGRQGLFVNNDVHDSMEMGLLATDCLLENDKGRWVKMTHKYLNAVFQGKK